MTKVEEKLQAIFEGSDGDLYRRIHDALVFIGLKAKDNNKTILYYYGAQANGETSLAAFRVEPRRVFSLPKSYWDLRPELHEEVFRLFSERELPGPDGGSLSENKSGGQIEISAATIERIVFIIRRDISCLVLR